MRCAPALSCMCPPVSELWGLLLLVLLMTCPRSPALHMAQCHSSNVKFEMVASYGWGNPPCTPAMPLGNCRGGTQCAPNNISQEHT